MATRRLRAWRLLSRLHWWVIEDGSECWRDGMLQIRVRVRWWHPGLWLELLRHVRIRFGFGRS